MPTRKTKTISTYRNAISHAIAETSSLLPDGDADVMHLLEFVLELNETGIIQNLEKKLTEKQKKRLSECIMRIKKEEPLPYIISSASFFGHRFKVTPDTLIPRVETERLVELAQAALFEKLFDENTKTSTTLNVIDVGTGTGCIIISIAKDIQEPVNYFASEISEKAHKVALENIAEHGLDKKIALSHGSLLTAVEDDIKFDLIVANLPYIPKADLAILPKSVKDFEPEVSLIGGENGASIIRELLVQSLDRVKKNAIIMLELQPKILEIVINFARRFYPKAKISIAKDQFDTDRFVIIKT